MNPYKYKGRKFWIGAGWSDAPHLSEETKRDLLRSIPPYQRDARVSGIPQLGSGAIYPIPESDIIVDSFPIPDHWPRSYGMDVGWNKTAVVWGARDNAQGIIYLYSEYYRGQAEPSVHTQGIKARGNWIPGVIDPASRGRSQHDGKQLLKLYMELGLDLHTAKNDVETGIYQVWELLSSGRLKIFKDRMPNWLTEFRLYQRDKDGKVVKEHDHLMDATRYFIMSGRDLMRIKPIEKKQNLVYSYGDRSETSWMN